MAFPQSFLDELIARSDIVDVIGSYVQLQRKGANLFGLCPFHSEKTGSFSVSPDKQIYYCFGCKRGGGVVNFIMEEENLSFPDAVRFLAKRAGMEVPEEAGDREEGRRRQRLLDLNRDAARGGSGAGISQPPPDTKGYRSQIWHGRLVRRLGCAADRHDEKGLHKIGAAGVWPSGSK